MHSRTQRASFNALGGIVLAACITFAPATARAGIPVIDVTAVANLIEQIAYWQQQITAMTNQLNQLQQAYESTVGGRGMQSLLPTSTGERNYLPADYAELLRSVDTGSNAYGGIAGQVRSAMQANAVLSRAQLDAMTPEMRQVVESGRRAAAMSTAMSQVAYQRTSERFAKLQQLISIIGAAGDTKAILDLQGRIGAEQTMLQNEQSKLQAMYQAAQAEQWVQQQRVRERIVSEHGTFGSRFAPSPSLPGGALP